MKSTTLVRRLGGALAVTALVGTACGSDLSREELREQSLEVFRTELRSTTAPGPGEELPAGSVTDQDVIGGADGAGGSAGVAAGRSSPAPAGAGPTTQRAGAARPAASPGDVAGTGTAGGPASGAKVPGSPTGPAAPGRGAAPGVPTPGSPGGPAGGGVKSEIRLGSIGVNSGPIGAAMQSFVHGAKAWAADVNARGGLNGHPVRLILVDDGGDPSAALALAKRLVEEEKIQAFYATHAPTTEQAYSSYAEEKQVPIIGTCGCSNVVDASPMIFHVGPGAPAGASWAHILPFTSLTDKRKVALLYCREVAVCPLLADGVKGGQQPSGYRIVSEAQISLAQPDFTAEMIAARNAGADVVVTIADNATTVRVARSAHRQSYRPVVSTQQSANEDSFIALGRDDVEGTVLAAVVPDYANSPKLADYRAAMARYVPGGRRGSFSAQTWAAGRLLEAVAGGFGDTVGPADVLGGLYALRNETLGGLVPPMNFERGRGHGGVNQCIIPARIEGGRFVYPFGDRFFCPPGFKPHGT